MIKNTTGFHITTISHDMMKHNGEALLYINKEDAEILDRLGWEFAFIKKGETNERKTSKKTKAAVKTSSRRQKNRTTRAGKESS
ncbi:hypothetical protein HGB07_08580 [Candidatus Roizmanbacteria bacterium]|nr:hypothetical protein [Candidatus Roizmanbacteria bacterium]